MGTARGARFLCSVERTPKLAHRCNDAIFEGVCRTVVDAIIGSEPFDGLGDGIGQRDVWLPIGDEVEQRLRRKNLGVPQTRRQCTIAFGISGDEYIPRYRHGLEGYTERLSGYRVPLMPGGWRWVDDMDDALVRCLHAT